MSTCRLSVTALFLFSLLGAVIGAAQEPTDPAKSVFHQLWIHLEFPEGVLNPDNLNSLIDSPRVFDAAYRSVAPNPDARSPLTRAEIRDTRGNTTPDRIEREGTLIVYLGGADAAIDGKRLLTAVVENLRAVLRDRVEFERSRIAARREAAAKQLADLSARQETLRNQQTQLLQHGGPRSAAELETMLAALNEKRRELELMLVG